MPVITISRQLGSLGDEIGSEVARRMGLRVVDHRVIAEVAQALGLSAAGFRERDEWQGSVVSDLVKTMRRLYPATVVPAPTEEPPELDEASYLQIIRQVIREVAHSDNAMIIGRAAGLILQGNPEVTRVLVVAPLEVRIERVMASQGLDRDRAAQRIKQVDTRRGRYIRHFYGADWMDVNHYDLTLNTGHFTEHSAAALIQAAASAEPLASQDSAD